MKNWPRVIHDAAKNLNIKADELVFSVQDASSQEQYLFNCSIQMQNQNKGLKLMTNIAIAAMHLSIIMKVIF